jgi:hypothetical protein
MIDEANVWLVIGIVGTMSGRGVKVAGVEGCVFWVAPHIPRIPRPVRTLAHNPLLAHTHPILRLVCVDAHVSYYFLYSYMLLASPSLWE